MIGRATTNKEGKKRFSLFAVIFAILIGSVSVSFVQNDEVLACGQPGEYTGYFYCRGVIRSPTYNVLSGGLPGTINTKAQFISHIEGLLNSGTYGGNNNAGYDKIGAAYIIQTMRGGKDHGFPDADDVADWKARINNPNITVGWENRRANINSARSPYANSVRDIYAYTGDNALYRSFVFYEGSTARYIVKQTCANPLGNLSLPDPMDYSLEPTMGVSPSSAEGGSSATLSPAVTNKANSTASGEVDWRVVTFNLAPGEAIMSGGISGDTAELFYGHGAQTVAGGQGKRTFPAGTTPTSLTVPNPTIPDLDVGWKVCYALSIRPHSSSDASARHSTPACITIAKKPKVQVLGGDLIVGKDRGSATSNVTTSTSVKQVNGESLTFGSWSEYAIQASGQVTAMASGAGYGNGASSNAICGVSLLTFSNVRAGQTSCANTNKPGGYSNTRSLPDISSRLSARTSLGANPTINLNSTNSGTYSATGSVTVNGATIPAGKWVVINAPSATVTIASNIEYTNASLTSMAAIPQVVIIANEIRIAGAVGRVDAWLIATGTRGNLITCSDVTSASELTASRCNQQLVVNGPVVARHLYLYRTAGSDGSTTGVTTRAAAGRPAEVFNLRPDAYLWATNYAANAGRLQTVNTKELPPLF